MIQALLTHIGMKKITLGPEGLIASSWNDPGLGWNR